MSKNTFHLVSLGCSKNTVDSESMGQLLTKSGYSFVADPSQASILIVNTCGFIGPAKEESLAVLEEMAAQKSADQYLIAAGCLTQRYGQEVAQQVSGIDGIIGTRRWMDIIDVVKQLRRGKHPEPVYHLPEAPQTVMDQGGVRRVAVQGSSAYLKIADGCRRPCAFCAIPLIKGTAVSRPAEAILEEARHLQNQGVKEIILIAQDTTDYGHDLGIKNGLADLLTKMAADLQQEPIASDANSNGVRWIRIMYAFPGYVTDQLINVMAAHQQVLPYLDIPLQHADPRVLRSMRRPANMEWVHKTLEKMRGKMEDLALRTTFIVGYPGETEEEFQTLLDFLAEVRFDRVGAFQFSFEPGTTSEELGDPIPAEVKQERWERLMALQQGISLEKNQALVGKTLEVLIEGNGDGLSMGRTYRDAPEIDGLMIVEGEHSPGEMIQVRVTDAMAYDLSGILESDLPIVNQN
ncbi:MAG: 30S ribosomal protein S12 methylthiotransferase RimO [Chloroflexota bacterium]|nr:MAG: 30S ribosomal protein S12 methylthiotransferase RimO [Chloroflexota bacterium]